MLLLCGPYRVIREDYYIQPQIKLFRLPGWKRGCEALEVGGKPVHHTGRWWRVRVASDGPLDHGMPRHVGKAESVCDYSADCFLLQDEVSEPDSTMVWWLYGTLQEVVLNHPGQSSLVEDRELRPAGQSPPGHVVGRVRSVD